MTIAEFFWAIGNLLDRWKVAQPVPPAAVAALERAQQAKTRAEFDAAGRAFLDATGDWLK